MLEFFVSTVIIVSQITMLSTSSIPKMDIGGVASFTARPVAPIWTEEYKCRYEGVAIAIERDWEEVIEREGSRTVIPPSPGKFHSYAVILNKRLCEDKEPQHVYVTGNISNFLVSGPFSAMERNRFVAMGLNENKEMQPKWIPQALRTLEAKAATNAAAKRFIDFNAEAKTKKETPSGQAKQEPATKVTAVVGSQTN